MHSIRLRGPWDVRPLARFSSGVDGCPLESDVNVPAGGRLQMPADWSALLGRDYFGRVRHVRRFNRPTGLTANSRVLLWIVGAIETATVTLNGSPLGSIRPAAQVKEFFDVTALLSTRNELMVDVEWRGPSPEFPDARGGSVGEVRLEISEPDANANAIGTEGREEREAGG